jgi:hypothetical protein
VRGLFRTAGGVNRKDLVLRVRDLNLARGSNKRRVLAGHGAEHSRHHTKDKQGFVVSVVAYDSLPGHQRFATLLSGWPLLIPGSACRIHTAGRWSFRLQEPSPRVLALAQKSASAQDNWFSEPQ